MDRIPDLPGEAWKPIEGYGGKYLVSNLGRIKSLKHANARLLTPFMNNKGYDRVCLSQFGKARHFLVSRLVAQAWCPNPDPEICNTVDHIDGNTSNNRADNLRWMSQQDNYRAYCEGRKRENEQRLQSNCVREDEK